MRDIDATDSDLTRQVGAKGGMSYISGHEYSSRLERSDLVGQFDTTFLGRTPNLTQIGLRAPSDIFQVDEGDPPRQVSVVLHSCPRLRARGKSVKVTHSLTDSTIKLLTRSLRDKEEL